MNNYISIVAVLFLSAFNFVNCEPKVAEATLQAGVINGTVYFSETEQGIHVMGIITGLPAGFYGFHVHEFGDVSTCAAAGDHFNPEGNNHGGREHQVRHVGDLGNVQFVSVADGEPVAYINFLDNVITFAGVNNILGRTLVLHEQADDLGLGGHETSLTTGNAGARVACGTIRQIGSESSVGSIAPSLVLILTTLFMYFSI